MIILCSACLLGVKCKYNGEHNLNEKVLKLAKEVTLAPVCPEQLGGLPTPRPKAEITGKAEDVLVGEARVLDENGRDVTRYFVKGAEETLKIAKLLGAKKALLKERSPSCGVTKVYDGTFSGKTKPGMGVTTCLLKKNGIKVYSEEQVDKLLQDLKSSV